MASIQITITDAGRAEVINAANNGTAPVTIAQVGVGASLYAPDPAATTLQEEIKRLDTIAGTVVADDTISVTITDESNDTYTVNEFGLYTDSGTLFAVYSHPTDSVVQKSTSGNLLMTVDVVLSTLDATNLTFGDTSFSNPPASETVKGVVELADETEALEGLDDLRAMTSLKVFQAVNGLFSSSNVDIGWQKLSSGIILQWGVTGQISTTSEGVLINTPISFPNKFFIVLASDNGPGCHSIGASPEGLSSFRAWSRRPSDGALTGDVNNKTIFQYLAIGC
uniref:gp53-like domain-containing protein n=1 Tax=Halomonas sp. TaxID=1486246 RepID=UPI00260BA749|nr:phage tail protein [Halomonas sp.]